MKQSTILNLVVIGIAGLCMLLGVLVLIGWHTNNANLIQVLPTFVPMQYNTALGFLLAGAGLMAAFKNKSTFGKIAFAIVGIIGFLTLTEYLAGIDLGIDELLMKHHIIVETSHPGRMAPNTAFCFLLTAIAILLFFGKGRNKNSLAGVLGALIFGLGLTAFIGYLIGMEVTYGWGKLTQMAVHTAFGFMLLGSGITAMGMLKENLGKNTDNMFKNIWLTGYAFVLALVIFFIDLSLPLGVAMGIPYVLFILFGWFIKHDDIILVLALFSTILVIAGYLYSNDGGATSWMIVTNRLFAILSIWLVAGLLNQIKKRETALKLTNSELDQYIVQLSNKNKELEQFTYIASHDLQEPLRTVTNFTRLFDEHYKEQLDEQAHSYLGFISQVSKRMSDLIKGLLDYSRIGYNKEKAYVNLHKCLKELQIDLHSRITESEATFQIDPLPKVKGFKVELGLLFQNLILNAIKFRKPDVKPEIKISSKEKANYYEFSVQDNGIGIAVEHQEKIFSIFKRLHTKKKYEGTGIGLAHCQKIVELHGGAIMVSSILDQGSNFIFTIKKK